MKTASSSQLRGTESAGSGSAPSDCASLHDDELEAVANPGVPLSSTRDTELQMGMCHPIAFKAKNKGCTASPGCDMGCENSADMFQQMRLLPQAQWHRKHHGNENSGPPKSISKKREKILDWRRLVVPKP